MTSEADWARAVEAAQKLGGLHGLVNNAGIYQPAALMAEWKAPRLRAGKHFC